jgi:hypothetical protein
MMRLEYFGLGCFGQEVAFHWYASSWSFCFFRQRMHFSFPCGFRGDYRVYAKLLFVCSALSMVFLVFLGAEARWYYHQRTTTSRSKQKMPHTSPDAMLR